MDQKLITDIRALGVSNTQDIKGHSVSQRLMPLLVDYRPVVRYINNVRCYAHIDVNSPQLQVFYKSSGKSGEGKIWSGLVETLATTLSDREKPQHLLDIEKYIKMNLDKERFSGNNANYLGILPEFGAIVIETDEFKFLKNVASWKNPNSAQICGVQLPMFVRSVEPVHVNVAQWYNDYMLTASTELTVMFFSMLSGTIFNQQMRRFVYLNEFVPFMMKISGVYNPILDTDLFARLQKDYKFFEKLVKVHGTCKVSGSDLKGAYFGDESSYIYYTTRANILRATGINPEVPQGSARGKDMYDINLFPAIIIDTAMGAYQEAPVPLGRHDVWTAYGKAGDSDDTPPVLHDINYKLTVGVGRSTPVSLASLSWTSAKILPYLMRKGFTLRDTPTLPETLRFEAAIASKLTVADLMNMEAI